MRKKSALCLDYKYVVHIILGAEPPRLPTCVPHKHPILINVSLAYQKKKKKRKEKQREKAQINKIRNKKLIAQKYKGS